MADVIVKIFRHNSLFITLKIVHIYSQIFSPYFFRNLNKIFHTSKIHFKNKNYFEYNIECDMEVI